MYEFNNKGESKMSENVDRGTRKIIQIIPAPPGTRLAYDVDGELEFEACHFMGLVQYSAPGAPDFEILEPMSGIDYPRADRAFVLADEENLVGVVFKESEDEDLAAIEGRMSGHEDDCISCQEKAKLAAVKAEGEVS